MGFFFEHLSLSKIKLNQTFSANHSISNFVKIHTKQMAYLKSRSSYCQLALTNNCYWSKFQVHSFVNPEILGGGARSPPQDARRVNIIDVHICIIIISTTGTLFCSILNVLIILISNTNFYFTTSRAWGTRLPKFLFSHRDLVVFNLYSGGPPERWSNLHFLLFFMFCEPNKNFCPRCI